MKTKLALILTVASTLLNCLVGCASRPAERAPAVSTAAITGSINSAQNNIAAVQSGLSDIDGKAVSIQQLLK